MIEVTHKGDFSKTMKFLGNAKKLKNIDFDKFGRRGVAALSAATPMDTGRTAASWYYKVQRTNSGVTITFCNRNIQNGVPIAIILQYGHGTRNGGWVEGRDYINPAVRTVFDQLVNDAWREVTSR